MCILPPTGAGLLPSTATVFTKNAAESHPSDFWVLVWPPRLQEVQFPPSSPRFCFPAEAFHPRALEIQ